MADLFDDLVPATAGAGLFDDLTPPPAKPAASRSPLQVADDVLLEGLAAMGGGIAAVGNFVSPGNRVSKAAELAVKDLNAEQSDPVKASKAKFQQEMQAAQTVGEEVATVGRYLRDNPLLATGQAVGSFVGPGAAVKGTQVAAKAAGFGAKAVSRAGLAGGSAVGAAMAGGDAAGDAYDLVNGISEQTLSKTPQWQELTTAGATPAQAREELAQRAARDASVIPALIGGISGAFGAERLLAGVGRKAGRVVQAAKATVSEGLQEAVEEGATTYEGRRAAAALDPSIDPTKGVAGAAALGGALGAGTGAVVGAVTAEQPSPRRPTVEEETKAVFDAEDIDSAIMAATELGKANLDLDRAIDEYGAPPAPAAAVAAVTPESGAPAPAAVLPGVRAPGAITEQTRQAVDRQAELAAQAAAAPTAFDRENAAAQAQVARGEPQPGAAANFADLTPMNPRQAKQRLTVLRDQAAQSGGNALELQVVSHPTQKGALAIGRRALPALDVAKSQQPAVSPEESQQRIESAALAGAQGQRRAAPEEQGRQAIVTRAMRAIEERGGVASPYEAQVLREANMGQPFDRIDESLAPPLREEEALTQATGVAVGRAPRETVAPKQQTPNAPQEIAAAAGRAGEQRMADLAAGAPARQEARAAADQAAIEQANQPPAAPPTASVTAALKLPPFQRSAEQKAVLNAARARYTAAEMRVLEAAANAPATLSPEDKLTLRQLQEGDSRRASPAEGSPRRAEGPAAEPTLSTLKKGESVVDPATLSNKTAPGRAKGTKRITREAFGTVQRLARVYGVKVVLYEGGNLDGFYDAKDPNTVYLNADASKPHLVVFGHELLHALKAASPRAYEDLVAAVKAQLKDGAAEQFGKDYGKGADTEELVADLVGNRMQEADFWADVFNGLGDSAAARLGAAIINAIGKLQRVMGKAAGFKTDELVKDLEAVRTAVKTAMRSYAAERRGAVRPTENVAPTQRTPDDQPRASDGTFKPWSEEDELTAAGAQLERSASPARDKEGAEFDVTVREESLGANKDERAVIVEARDPSTGQRRGLVDFAVRADGVLVAENAKVAPAFKGRGIAELMYRAARDAGYDIAPGRVQTDEGLRMVESFQKKGLINKEAEGKRFRAGDLDLVPIAGETIPGERVTRASARREDGVPEYGEAREGAISVLGVHYSREPRTTLSSAMAGTGLKGADNDRLERDGGEKRRVYFYVEKGRGVVPESGVGGYAHQVQLNNLYDAEADPLFLAEDNPNPTKFEAAVTAAGFDGYYRDSFRNDVGAAVLLGAHQVPVKQVGQGPQRATGAMPARAQPAQRTGWRKTLADFRASKRLPSGAVPGERWGLRVQQLEPELYAAMAPSGVFEAIADRDAMYRDEVAGEYRRRASAPAPKEARMASARREEGDTKYQSRARELAAAMKPPRRSAVGFFTGERKAPLLRTNFEIARYFTEKNSGAMDDWTKAPAQKRMQDALYADALQALSQDATAVGWYDRKVKAALALIAQIHPEIATNEQAKFGFITMLAITSNSTAVNENFEAAEKLYARWKDTQQWPTEVPTSAKAADAMAKGLAKMGELVERDGWEAVRDFMTADQTIADIEAFSGTTVQSELADEKVYGAVFLGSKIGAFFNNLYGNFTPVTMDRWFMRSIGRVRGDMLRISGSLAGNLQKLDAQLTAGTDTYGEDRADLQAEIEAYLALPQDQQLDVPTALKALPSVMAYAKARNAEYAKGITLPDGKKVTYAKRTAENLTAKLIHEDLTLDIQAPSGGGERRVLRGIMRRLQKQLAKDGIPIEMADLQAVLWYYEKDLFDLLKGERAQGELFNGNADPEDYETAARRVVRLVGEQGAGDAGPGRSGRGQRAERAQPAEQTGDLFGDLNEKASPRRSATLADFTQERLPDLLEKTNWAVLTAEDPGAKKQSARKNAVDMEDLEADLKARGFSYAKAVGKYGETQNAFIVTGISEAQAKALGEKYGQESILTRDGLVYMDGRPNTPTTGAVTVYETPPDDFYTAVPSAGAYFQVGLDFEAEPTRASPAREEEPSAAETKRRVRDLRRRKKVLEMLKECLSK